MIRLLLSAWPLLVGLVLFLAGFFVACLFAAGGQAELRSRLELCRGDRDGWRRRALTAEANTRTAERLAEVLPLTYTPSAAEQERGLKVVQGGRR